MNDSLWLPNHVIDDATSARTLNSDASQMGYAVDDYEERQTAYLDGVGARFDIPLIPESEWKERIEERERKGYTNLALRKAHNLAPLNQNGFPYCLLPNALIRMADGSDKQIVDVKLGDEVYTAEGNISTVEQLHRRHHSGQMVTVKLWGHGHLKLTPNHSVLTRRGYVRSGELKSDDWVRLPRTMPVRCGVIQTEQHAGKVRAYAGGGRKSETWNAHSIKRIPDIIELTPGFGRLLGLYVAEGFTAEKTGAVAFAFNANEEHTLAADAVRLIESELGETARMSFNKANGCVVTFFGKQWVKLFRSLCGHLAHGKRLSPDVMSGPEPFLRELLRGWLDGDGSSGGSVRKNRGYEIGATVSKRLASNMFAIANALGMRPSILLEEPQKNRHAKTRRPVWKLSLQSQADNYRVQLDDAAMWRRVRSVKTEDFTGYVYNIGVVGDNSYIAEGVGVHNCWAHGPTQALHYLQLQSGEPHRLFSAISVAAPVKNFSKVGGWGDQAVSYMAEHGINYADDWPINKLDSRLLNAENREKARQNLVTEWWDLKPKDFPELVTCLLNGFACAVAYLWWGHLVCAIDVVLKGGEVCVLIDNSWGSNWGDNGLSVISGNKKYADEQIAPRVLHARAT